MSLCGALALLLSACGGSKDNTPPPEEPDVVRWEQQEVPTEAELLSVWGRAADEVWAVGWGGTVLRYDGERWTPETTTSTVPLTQVRGLPLERRVPLAERPDPVVFATGWDGAILTRQPNGRWIPAPVVTSTIVQPDDLLGLALGGPKSGLAVGAKGLLYRWDGDQWTPGRLQVPSEHEKIGPISPRGALQRVWAASDTSYFISGSGGATYRSSDGLQTFSRLDTTLSEPLRGVWGTSSSDVYTVGLGSLVLFFDGGSWQRVMGDGLDKVPTSFLFDIHGRSAGDLTVVGWKGLILRRQGSYWSQEDSTTTRDLRGVWNVTDSSEAFAVGAGGTVLHRPLPKPQQ